MARTLVRYGYERCGACSGIGFHDCKFCNNEGKIFVEVYATPESEYKKMQDEYSAQKQAEAAEAKPAVRRIRKLKRKTI